MAKVGSIQKNSRRKKLVKKYFSKRMALKEQIYNKNITLEDRFDLVRKLSSLPKNSSVHRVRNRCALTGRPRAFNRKMGISRIMVRKLAGEGALPGIVKASW